MKLLKKIEVDFITGYLPAGASGTAMFMSQNFDFVGLSKYAGFIFQGDIIFQEPRGTVYFGVPVPASAPIALPIASLITGDDMALRVSDVTIDVPIVAYPSSRAAFRCKGVVSIFDQVPERPFATKFMSQDQTSKELWSPVTEYGAGEDSAVLSARGFSTPIALPLAYAPTGTWGVKYDADYVGNAALRAYQIDYIAAALPGDVDLAVISIPVDALVPLKKAKILPLWDVKLTDSVSLIKSGETQSISEVADSNEKIADVLESEISVAVAETADATQALSETLDSMAATLELIAGKLPSPQVMGGQILDAAQISQVWGYPIVDEFGKPLAAPCFAEVLQISPLSSPSEEHVVVPAPVRATGWIVKSTGTQIGNITYHESAGSDEANLTIINLDDYLKIVVLKSADFDRVNPVLEIEGGSEGDPLIVTVCHVRWVTIPQV